MTVPTDTLHDDRSARPPSHHLSLHVGVGAFLGLADADDSAAER